MLIPNEMLAKVQMLTPADIIEALSWGDRRTDRTPVLGCAFHGFQTNGKFLYSIVVDIHAECMNYVEVSIQRKPFSKIFIFVADY